MPMMIVFVSLQALNNIGRSIGPSILIFGVDITNCIYEDILEFSVVWFIRLSSKV